MFRKVFVLVGVVALSACASSDKVSFVKKGEVPGSAGLEVAAKKCAPLEGSREWQTCVAHYDGLYTKSDGVIKRSYVPSVDAPTPTGQVETCSIKAVWDSRTATWSYSGCESGH